MIYIHNLSWCNDYIYSRTFLHLFQLNDEMYLSAIIIFILVALLHLFQLNKYIYFTAIQTTILIELIVLFLCILHIVFIYLSHDLTTRCGRCLFYIIVVVVVPFLSVFQSALIWDQSSSCGCIRRLPSPKACTMFCTH